MFARNLLAFFVALTASGANAACLDPAEVAQSSVSVTRHLDDAERRGNPDVIAIQGSGWFLSPTTIVTVEHVAKAMKLTSKDWKPLEITAGNDRHTIRANIQRVVGDSAEKLAVIELQRAVSDSRSVEIRKDPLLPEEQVVTLAYLGGRPHLVQGRFVRFGEDGGKLAGMVLLEMYEGENRLIVDHGSSGAPVIDCEGRVAAVVSNVFTQSFVWSSREIRISTAWGMPNVASVPARLLETTRTVN